MGFVNVDGEHLRAIARRGRGGLHCNTPGTDVHKTGQAGPCGSAGVLARREPAADQPSRRLRRSATTAKATATPKTTCTTKLGSITARPRLQGSASPK